MIENLDSMLNLAELYLSDNGLKKIEGLTHLVHLKVLDLSNNQIERLENVSHLKELEEFWFNNNQLAKWEDVDLLKELTSLRCLYMEHNPIYYMNNTKPSSITDMSNDNQLVNPSYRRKIIFTLPKLEQLDATLCRATQN